MWWILVHIAVGCMLDGSAALNSTDCHTEPSCMKCGPKGCIKCPSLIVFPTRRCVSTCPYGHRARWSTLHDYMGQMCVHNGNFLGLPAETGAVLAGIITGTVLCLLLIASTVLYIRVRRAKMVPASVETSSELDDSPERRDFLKQLETLRPYADSYLEMLNDARRQVRALHQGGDGAAAYRPVVRDLAKILLLLNRNPERIAVPDDWEHLFGWAEKALRRYKRMSDASQPQVAQLISFLQGSPVDTDVRGSTTMSTFKPDQVFGSALSLSFHSNYEAAVPPLNPQWKFEYSLVDQQQLQPTSEFNPAVWKNSKEFLNTSLFLDDDFCQLGFRPQDEITTEL